MLTVLIALACLGVGFIAGLLVAAHNPEVAKEAEALDAKAAAAAKTAVPSTKK